MFGRGLFFILTIFVNLGAIPIQSILEEELKESVYSHIQEKLENAKIIEYPFPHIFIEGIFPEDFYQYASTLWPEESNFVSHHDHLVLPTTYGVLEQTNLTKEQKTFWRVFGEVIINRYIKPKIVEKFKPYFHLKFGLENYDLALFAPIQDIMNFRQDNLVLDKNNYKIGPHIDQLNILATMLIYMPLDSSYEGLGTRFWEGAPADNANASYYDGQSDLHLAKIVPYRPNTLVAFMQTPFSWHSYNPVSWEDSLYKRRLYHAPIFFSPEFMRKHILQYNRNYVDDYFFDYRYLEKNHWDNIWGEDE